MYLHGRPAIVASRTFVSLKWRTARRAADLRWYRARRRTHRWKTISPYLPLKLSPPREEYWPRILHRSFPSVSSRLRLASWMKSSRLFLLRVHICKWLSSAWRVAVYIEDRWKDVRSKTREEREIWSYWRRSKYWLFTFGFCAWLGL